MLESRNKYSNTKLYIYIIICICIILCILIIPINIINKYCQILTLIIISLGFLITMINFNLDLRDREKNFGINYSNLTQNKIYEIEKLFMNNSNLDRLYFEMYKDDLNINNIKNKFNYEYKDTYEILKIEHQISNRIFQTISDIYISENFNNYDETHEWINTFTKWLKSKILIKHWKYLKDEYNIEVQIFINKLINQNYH